jgi:Leucine-rich repeat (LRR) protein
MGCVEITALPDINRLVMLNVLLLEDCDVLAELPPIGHLSNLDPSFSLDGFPRLWRLHSSIGQLTQLTSLSLRSTGLVALPNELSLLTALQNLDIAGCAA